MESLLQLSLTPLNITLAGMILLLIIIVCLLVGKLADARRSQAVAETESEQMRIISEGSENRCKAAQDEAQTQRDENTALRERNAALQGDNDRLTNENNSLSHDIDKLRSLLSDSQQDLTRKEAQCANLEQLRAADQESFLNQQEELKQRLTNMSKEMLDKRGEELRKSSAETFSQAVNPLKEELKVFRELVDRTRKDSSEQAGKFSAEFKTLQEAQQNLTKQASDLTEALRSGGKAQGMWGELQLEKSLELSGLVKGRDYEREVAGDRSLDEHGRPDAVIRLPDGHCLIIDAKCSLTAYTAYCAAATQEDRDQAGRDHLRSVASHLGELVRKDYSGYKSLWSPSFVFMFIPVDGALTLATTLDPGLYEKASHEGVCLVSPSTLVPALRVVANLWVLARQNEHIRDLAHEAQKIADKYERASQSFQELIKSKAAYDNKLDTLESQLFSGRGSLQKLLLRFSQKAPQVLKELDGNTVETDPEPPAEENAENGERGIHEAANDRLGYKER